MAPEAVVARVFGVDARQVGDATSNTTLPEWDSLGHMTLVVELEATYGVAFSPEDALAMTDVAAIKRILTQRGARW